MLTSCQLMQIFAGVLVFRICESLSKNGFSGGFFAEVAACFVAMVFAFLFRTVELESKAPDEDDGSG